MSETHHLEDLEQAGGHENCVRSMKQDGEYIFKPYNESDRVCIPLKNRLFSGKY